MTVKSVAFIDDVLGEAFEEHGAVSGRVQTVSERGSIKFVIYDSLTDKPIQCLIGEDQMEEAMHAFGHRAEVYGMVAYKKDGQARRIRVEEINVFPPDAELPSAKDVRGLLRNWQP